MVLIFYLKVFYLKVSLFIMALIIVCLSFHGKEVGMDREHKFKRIV